MDPKQTEGQNGGSAAPQGGFSFSNGSTPSGTPPTNTTAPGTLSTGANVSRTMDDLNVSDRKSATSNSPFAKHHFDKVAPGTGDILINQSSGSIISSGAAEKKGINRGRLIQFGLIFGGIALVALVIFTVVMVINNNNNKPKNDSSSSPVATASAEDSLIDYMNSFVNNTDNKEDITSTWKNYFANSSSIYAVEQAESAASSAKTEYLNSLNQKWEDFMSKYSGQYAKSAQPTYVPIYFYYIALSPELTEQDLYDLYTKNDQNLDEAKKSVSTIMTNPSNNYAVYVAYQTKLELYNTMLDMMNDAKNAGCLSASTTFRSCDYNTLPSYENYQKALAKNNTEIPEIIKVYKDGAISILQIICKEVFGNVNTAQGDSL